MPKYINYKVFAIEQAACIVETEDLPYLYTYVDSQAVIKSLGFHLIKLNELHGLSALCRSTQHTPLLSSGSLRHRGKQPGRRNCTEVIGDV